MLPHEMFKFRPYESASKAVGDHHNYAKFMATGLYWLSELQQLKCSCGFRAFSRTSAYYCARTHAALQINLYGQVLTLRTLAIARHFKSMESRPCACAVELYKLYPIN